MSAASERRLDLLTGLYGDAAEAIERRAIERLGEERGRRRSAGPSERDAWLIAYADSFREPGVAPLVTLGEVLDRHLAPEINGVHVLPFHPASSDRGFSVIDYAEVEPSFGTWDDIGALAARHRLMADAVLNHMSAASPWFRGFLAGDPELAGFFRTVDADADLSDVVRPRTSPLVTTYEGADGAAVRVWTTFSADQVDLDYGDPDVLLAALEVLLRYRAAGASVIRLDAIAFLWKVEGSPSINLPETHDLIELLRSWLDEVDPGLMIVTETNVPHDENVAYLGRPGRREAQAVYQFALPPLLLHTLSTGDPAALVAWAGSLEGLPEGRTYLNFTSSHDGVGVRPVEGLLPDEAVAALTALCERAGGIVNLRRRPDGSDAPYELASTWFALMSAIDADPELALARHVLSQAFVLAMRGIPLLYTHVLLASDNDVEGYRRSGIARDLNRADVDPVSDLDRTLADPGSRPARVLGAIRRMLRWRASCEAFHPDAAQRVDREGTVVIVERVGRSGVLARVMLNVGTAPVTMRLDDHEWHLLGDRSPAPDTIVVPALGSIWIATETGDRAVATAFGDAESR